MASAEIQRLQLIADDVDVLTNAKDGATNALNTVDYAHHEIHSGSHYYLKSYLDFATNAVIDVRITTPNTTKYLHLLPIAQTQTEFLYHIYEGVEIDVAGTAVTPTNRNRNSSNTSVATIDVITNTSTSNANADTDISGATDIYPGITGSGKKAGGEMRGSNEVVLRANTIYSLRLVCNSAGWADYIIDWYEHTDKH